MERKFSDLNQETVVEAVDILLQEIINHAALDQRIEIRGFGKFVVAVQTKRKARNPQNGQIIDVQEKNKIKFKKVLLLF